MSLVVITGGLSKEQLSFIEEAVDQSFGSGVVTIKEYSLEDISLVKELRLGIKDSSVLSVYLGSFSGVNVLEKSRDMLEGSGKFLEVLSTESLVSHLNKNYGVSLEYTPEESAIPVVESPKVEISMDISLIEDKYKRLLSAKDDTIHALELQLEEQKNSYEGIISGIAKGSESVSSDFSEKEEELQDRISSLISENEALTQENNNLRNNLEVLKEQKSELSSKFNSADALSRSQETLIQELKGKLANKETNKVDITPYETKISSLESELVSAKDLVAELSAKASSADSESNQKDSRISELESLVASLRGSLEEERRNVNILNRRLVSMDAPSQPVVESEESIELPQNLMQPVWGSIWKSSMPSFKNITFLFSGTGDSHREAYIHAERKLSNSPRGGIFYDLSTESVADYRFGVKRGHEVGNWYKDSKENLKKYLSKTKYSDVYVLGTFKGSINEMSHFTLDLYSRLSYLDSLNVNIIVYGGDISSYFGRNLMSSALYGASVEVVCRSLGTSARSMYYHSKLIGGSSKARYYLVGNLDAMSKTVFTIAKKDGYSWEVLDA